MGVQVGRHLDKAASQAKYRVNLRLKIVAHYGGACRCCGRTEPALLDIHHVSRDGAVHRAAAKRSTTLEYARIWREKPLDIELLCANCHRWEHRGSGPCPH